MSAGARQWTYDELQSLVSMKNEGISIVEISRKLNRSIKAVNARFDKILKNDLPVGKIVREPKSTPIIGDDILVELDKYLSAPRRDLTGYLLGDPPIGFSALDKKTMRTRS